MVLSLLLECSGCAQTVEWSHQEVSARLGGRLTFVAGDASLQVFAVGLADASDHDVNPFCTDTSLFDACDTRGPVLFVSTDEQGDPCDVDVERLCARLGIAL